MPEAVAAPGRPAQRRRLGGAAIASVGVALPPRAVGNGEVAARIGVTPDWIVERTGVRERRVAAGGEPLPELAATAASRACAAAGVDPWEVDLVLAATMSHEQITPHLAPLVAARIGAEGAGALDVSAACNGFLGALALATAQIEAQRAAAVLVVGADVMTRMVDPADRATAALFGDGAGAAVVRPATAGAGIGPVILGSDGALAGLVGASRAEGVLRMEGQDTFREAVRRITESTNAAVAAAGVELRDIDAFVYHQANARILRSVGARLGLEPARVVDCIDRYGNTSAATLPLALHAGVEEGLIAPGALVLVGAFGGGLSWGATVLEWEEAAGG